MGQHNTVVVNDTNKTIKIILTDKDKRNTSQIIEHGENCTIPTIRGSVTLTVFPEEPNGEEFVTTSEASFTNDSDRNFIVMKDSKGRINISRLKYESISRIQHGSQDTRAVEWFKNAINKD